jgi:hypothetical protein
VEILTAMRRLAIIALATTLVGCTWVHMAPDAKAVRVINAGAPPAGCQKMGEISVSVKDSVAFYERNQLRVREELETLARNEGPGLGADTIQPLGEPANGEQRFAGYRCGGGATGASGMAPPQPIPAGTAQTYPIGG